MTSRDDIVQLQQMRDRGEISIEEFSALRDYIHWGTPIPAHIAARVTQRVNSRRAGSSTGTNSRHGLTAPDQVRSPETYPRHREEVPAAHRERPPWPAPPPLERDAPRRHDALAPPADRGVPRRHDAIAPPMELEVPRRRDALAPPMEREVPLRRDPPRLPPAEHETPRHPEAFRQPPGDGEVPHYPHVPRPPLERDRSDALRPPAPEREAPHRPEGLRPPPDRDAPHRPDGLRPPERDLPHRPDALPPSRRRPGADLVTRGDLSIEPAERLQPADGDVRQIPRGAPRTPPRLPGQPRRLALPSGSARTTVRRLRHRVTVLFSAALVLLLVATGVWWVIIRPSPLSPGGYAKEVCGMVRAWQGDMNDRRSELLTAITGDGSPEQVRQAVVTFFQQVEQRTATLSVDVEKLGTPRADGGKSYAKQLREATATTASDFHDEANRARELDTASPAAFQPAIQEQMLGIDGSTRQIMRAMAGGAEQPSQRMRQALEAEPLCAPFVG